MKKQILGIELENMSAGAAVEKMMELLNGESLGICAFVHSGMLLEAEQNEEYRELLKRLTLPIIGDEEILKAMGENREERCKEVENHTALHLLLRRLIAENKSVAVLTETKEEKKYAEEKMKSEYPSLRMAGSMAIEDFEDEDTLVNQINGVDVDVVIAELSIPGQEVFIFENKAKLNAGLWLGMGKAVPAKKKTESMPGFLEKLIEKRIFKKKVTQYF